MAPQAAVSKEPMKEKTPRGDFHLPELPPAQAPARGPRQQALWE
ncbi:hypothetical protein [Vitiosangium sp. GDMCC 1.1324]|nr:hypothetical protein [Vitiosangium sp. GDMCC 1.1324]